MICITPEYEPEVYGLPHGDDPRPIYAWILNPPKCICKTCEDKWNFMVCMHSGALYS